MKFPPSTVRDDDCDDWYDLDLLPVPPRFGAAFTAVFLQALSWSPARVTALRDIFTRELDDNIAEYEGALDRLDDALTAADLIEHPTRGAAGPVTTIGPWSDRCISILRGAGYVLQAVAARSAGVVSDDDFATITNWWVREGLRLPADDLEGQVCRG